MNTPTTNDIRTALANTNTPHITPTHVATQLRHTTPLNPKTILTTTRTLHADLTGLGPLQPLADHPHITDILVNNPTSVWADTGNGLTKTPITFTNEQHVRELATRLATHCGRRLDDQTPYVDAYLPGRIRLHAVIPPITQAGTSISLRFPAHTPLTLTDLATRNALPTTWTHLLTTAITTKTNIVVTGGTGTGKTTLLNALLATCNPQERLITVEDTPELHPNQPNTVALTTRVANTEGKGTVTLGDLIRQALRMRPDRIVVGESRGPEIRELLLALNTGHAGSCTSLHANSVTDVPNRIIALGALAGLTPEAISAQMHGALQLFVHLRRTGTMRWIHQIGILATPHTVTDMPAVHVAATYHPQHGERQEAAWPHLMTLLGHPC